MVVYALAICRSLTCRPLGRSLNLGTGKTHKFMRRLREHSTIYLTKLRQLTGNWDGSVRATPRTPRSCGGLRGSVPMRPLGLAGQDAHSRLQARRALVSLASIAE